MNVGMMLKRCWVGRNGSAFCGCGSQIERNDPRGVSGIFRRFVLVLTFPVFLLFTCIPVASAFTATLSPTVLSDINSIGNRTPLILIHGLRGKETGGATAYWQNIINNFDGNVLQKYKVYLFEYDSDQIPVTYISQYLANSIAKNKDFYYTDNTDAVRARPVVILAHSMGGLIARDYMHYHLKYDFNRNANLITLATPHHGTPAANGESRNQLANNSNNRDFFYTYPFGWPLGSDWLTAINGASLKINKDWWSNEDGISQDKPNRSDLRWDNFDNVMSPQNNEINAWLSELNSDYSYDNKIITYYGYLDPNSQLYQNKVDMVYTYGGSSSFQVG